MKDRILQFHRLTRCLLALACAAVFSPANCRAQSAAVNGTSVTPALAPPVAGGTAASLAPKQPTEITAQDETTFDEKSHMAVFIGKVVVIDPQFHLTCDKLTAYLKSGSQKHEAAATPHPTPSKSRKPAGKGDKGEKADSGASSGGGLDHAIAVGNVLVTQEKKDPSTGEVTHYLGKGTKGDYDANTGDMKLTGWPEMEQGLNKQVATTEGTIMIMNREGGVKTFGPSKSVIVDQSENKKDDKPGNGTAKPAKTEARKP